MTISGGPILQFTRSVPARLLVGIALPIILWLTLRSDPHAASVVDLTPWWCISCGPVGTADQFQNLLLLLPLGVAAGLAGWTMRSAGAALLALALVIETVQGVAGNGRDAALGDVLANGAGGLLGWCLVQLGGRHWPRVRRAAAPIVVGLFIAQLIATSSLSGPAPTGPEPWQLRVRPETVDRPTYRGEFISVTLGGRPILTQSPKPEQPAERNAPDVVARFTWDPPDQVALTPILRLDDARRWSIMSVDRRGQFLGINLRTTAGQLRLRTPTWLMPVPDAAAAGDTLTIALSMERGYAEIALTHGERPAVSRRFPYGAQHGWVLINPFARAYGSLSVWQRWTLAWLFGWGVLLGLATMAARRPAAWLGAALAGLLMTSVLVGAGATLTECAALLFGALAARLTGRTFRRSPVEA